MHRLGIQAFQPILIEGSAIQIHPLVCSAFNADFDGDQMAVHVPLSHEAQLEAREIMAADKNILKPGSGEPVVSAKLLDILLGCYWMTKIVAGEKGEGKIFTSPQRAVIAYNFGELSPRAQIKIMPDESLRYAAFAGTLLETSVGRILFNSIFPEDYPYINQDIQRKKIATIVDDLIERYGIENVPTITDRIKDFGFKYATRSGVTWGIDDIKEPEAKSEVIAKARQKAEEVLGEYNDGFLSAEEKYRKNIEIWQKARQDVEKLIPDTLDKNGSVYDMVMSGARGSLSQITNMAGMKGLIQSTTGEIIEFPILSSSKKGLTPIEYFITTHGSRKGLTDTALNTAKAGYLTRKLFVVAQDTMIVDQDCGTKDGIWIRRIGSSGMEVPFAKNLKGRVLARDLVVAEGSPLFKRGHLLSKEDAVKVEETGVKEVYVRSPLVCKTTRGICVQCYGMDLGKNHLVEIGEAVGTVAGQAIGEPGTQLTMRTFHAGGTAAIGGDITAGLPRVEEIFEKRAPKNPAVVAHMDGMVSEIKDTGKERTIVLLPDVPEKKKSRKKNSTEYAVHANRLILVKVGDKIAKGELLTDGSADIDEIFEYAGKEKTEEYIISEVSKPYELQGESVARKHIEVIIRQMFSRRIIKDPGGTTLSRGDVVEQFLLAAENAMAEERGLPEAKTESTVMGITEVSLSRKSFLSAASFQHTTRVLINSAVRGNEDKLTGLMENVILGRLIPAGTGFPGSPKQRMVERLKDSRDRL